MQKILFSLSVLPLTIAFACSSESTQPIASQEEAVAGFQATQQALSQGMTGINTNQVPSRLEFRNSTFEGSVAVDFTAKCAQGGELSFKGELSVGAGAAVDDFSNVQFVYDVVFSDCETAGDITINGDLSYSALAKALSSEEESEASYTLAYTGDLEFSGAVEGSCKIDVEAAFSASSSGSQNSASYKYSGTICGFDADASLSVSTDN